jgi:protein phosphatase
VKVTVGAASDIGQVREGNEDAYLLLDPLYAVADGMGGHLGGEVASSLALETIRERFSEGVGSLADQVGDANRAVYERSQRDREVRGMGTTLTAALVDGGHVRLAHVGDSRAYLFREGDLRMLTKDHTVVAKMVEEGEITPAEAETHPHRNIVTRVLGVEQTVRVDEGVLDVRDGDRLLLCSDGLTGMVTPEEIATVLRETSDPQQAVERLVRAANAGGGIDNITAVLLDFADDGSETTTATTRAREEGGALRETATSIPTPVDRRPTPSASAPSRPRVSAPTARRIGIGAGVAVAVVVLALVGLRLYLDSQWFVGISNGRVAIFRGVPASVGGFELNSVVVETDVPAGRATELAVYRDLADGITADDRAGAEAVVEQIRIDVASQRPTRSPEPSP